MSQQLDYEEQLLNMIMESNSAYRFAGICDYEGNILWSSSRNGVDKMLPLSDTKKWLKRAADNWKDRECLFDKIGRGRFAYVGYENLRHITVPLRNGHILFITLDGKSFPYMGDIMKIVDFMEKRHTQ